MQQNLEHIMLEAARNYLNALTNEQFLAHSCDLSSLHGGIIRLVHNQSLRRNFRAPKQVTADFFLRSKKQIGRILKKN